MTDLLYRRSMMPDYGGGGLPAGYTAANYIVSDGTAYIDTGITGGIPDNLHMEVSFLILYKPGNYDDSVFETGTGVYDARFMLRFGYNRPQIRITGYTSVDMTGVGIAAGSDMLMSYSLSNDGIVCSAKNVTTSAQITATRPTTDMTSRIPSGKYTSNFRTRTQDYWGYQRITIGNDNISADFVPCTRDADQVVGMFDFISQTFFPPANGGAFTAY